MVRYECDRCQQPIQRRDLRSGRVDHLADSALSFELCFSCFVVLRAFLRGDAVAACDQRQETAKLAMVG
jgi:hypothetical protein